MRLAQFLCCCEANPTEKVSESFSLFGKKVETRSRFDKVAHIKELKQILNFSLQQHKGNT
jgi:hypothetical protein